MKKTQRDRAVSKRVGRSRSRVETLNNFLMLIESLDQTLLRNC